MASKKKKNKLLVLILKDLPILLCYAQKNANYYKQSTKI